MPEDNQVGIWCKEDNTFYYMETGPMPGHNNVERLKRILTQRGLIKFNTDGDHRTFYPYKVIMITDAKVKGCPIKPVYLTKHIKAVMEADLEPEETEKVNPWE